MSLPYNYLLTAPSDAENAMGEVMLSSDLVKGLRMCNNNIFCPDRGNGFGETCIWLGEPSRNFKIAGIPKGPMPEFTQLGPGGRIEVRGWRSVLSKAISCRAVKLSDVERVFKITMDLGKPDKVCQQCRRENLPDRSVKSASGLCDLHDWALKEERKRQRQVKDAPLKLAESVSMLDRQPVSVNVERR